MYGKTDNPVANAVFSAINRFVMRKSLDESMAKTEKYTPEQENRFKVVRQAITKGNIWLLKLSGGRLGNSFLGVKLLLMTTIGRKSGKPRTLPMFYLQDNDKFVLVASNGGLPSDPVWLLNVLANPDVMVKHKGVARKMRARVASPEEKAGYWPRLTEIFPMWQEVANRSNRDFKVVMVEPVDGDASATRQG